MATRRVITEAMRETARERAHGYLAARGMSDSEVFELARYHVRHAQASNAARVSERATRIMLGSLVVSRLARDGRPYVAPRPARVRYSRGR